jgi:hypothetical protein
MKLRKGEVLVDAFGGEGYYKVSNFGRVFRVRFLPNCSFVIVQELKIRYNSRRGMLVHMSMGKSSVVVQLSSLVFDSFNRDYAGCRYYYVDGDRSNIKLENLKCKLPLLKRGSLRHDITKLLNEGLSVEDIAVKLNCSKQHVTGLQPGYVKTDRGKYKDRITELLEQGLSKEDIKSEVDCTLSYVAKLCREYRKGVKNKK